MCEDDFEPEVERPKSGAAVIVCRNNLAYTKAAIASLQASTVPLKILAIDNASSDGTAQWLATQPIYRITFGDVRSLSRCWNDGLVWCWSGFREALVINNDVELLPNTFEALHGCLEPPVGMTTCVSVDRREKLVQPDSYSLRPHPDFSCFMIHRLAYSNVGPFDERYEGGYFEDNAYHVRMHRAKIKAVNIGLPFLHHGGTTLKNAGPDERDRINKHYTTNKKLFYSQFGCYPGTKGYEDLFK